MDKEFVNSREFAGTNEYFSVDEQSLISEFFNTSEFDSLSDEFQTNAKQQTTSKKATSGMFDLTGSSLLAGFVGTLLIVSIVLGSAIDIIANFSNVLAAPFMLEMHIDISFNYNLEEGQEMDFFNQDTGFFVEISTKGSETITIPLIATPDNPDQITVVEEKNAGQFAVKYTFVEYWEPVEEKTKYTLKIASKDGENVKYHTTKEVTTMSFEEWEEYMMEQEVNP